MLPKSLLAALVKQCVGPLGRNLFGEWDGLGSEPAPRTLSVWACVCVLAMAKVLRERGGTTMQNLGLGGWLGLAWLG